MSKILIELLNNKKEYLSQYESLSYQILNSEIDELNDVFEKRELIINEINAIDLKINQWIDESDKKSEYILCLKPGINKDSLDLSMLEVVEAYQFNYDSLLNIQSLETTIQKQLEAFREELQQNLIQVENVSKIKKYFETYETEIHDMSQMARKSTKI